MSAGLDRAVKDILQAIAESAKKKTSAYDTQATVKRVDGNIAWVHIPGGVDETPMKLTIDAKEGDVVQVHVGGGKAWITGNQTAPPTDDTQANVAKKRANLAYSLAGKAISTAEEVSSDLDELASDLDELASEVADISEIDDVTVQYCLSNSNSTFQQYGNWSNTPPTYVSGKYYWTRSVIEDDEGNVTYGEPRYSQDTQLSVETDVAFKSNNNHFWYDSSGAYVTTQNKSYATGSAVRITASGILQQVNGSTVSSWTNSGISFLQGGDTVASFGSGGVYLYGGGYLGASVTASGMTVYLSGSEVASFGSTIKLGNSSGRNWVFNGANLYFYQGSTLCGTVSSIYGSSNGVAIASPNSIGYLSVTGSDVSLSGALIDLNSSGNLQFTANGLIYFEGTTTFDGHIKPDGTSFNCGTSSNPWNNCYISTYFASTTEPSSLSQDYAVAWHKTNSNNYVLCRPSSSRKWKKDIELISDAIADPKKLYDVRVVQFRYKDKNADDPNNTKYNPTALDVGFIAEEVAEAYPLGAVINENGEPDDWNARRIIPPMLALIQEQNKRITELEARL